MPKSITFFSRGKTPIYVNYVIAHNNVGRPLRDMYDFPISLLKNTPNPSRSVHAAPPTTTGISARLLTTNNEPLTIGKGVSPFPYSQALSGRAVMLAQALLMAAAIIFLPGGSRWSPSRASSVLSSPRLSAMPGVMSIWTCVSM